MPSARSATRDANRRRSQKKMSEFDEEDPEIAAASAQGGYTNDENDNEGFVSSGCRQEALPGR